MNKYLFSNLHDSLHQRVKRLIDESPGGDVEKQILQISARPGMGVGAGQNHVRIAVLGSELKLQTYQSPFGDKILKVFKSRVDFCIFTIGCRLQPMVYKCSFVSSSFSFFVREKGLAASVKSRSPPDHIPISPQSIAYHHSIAPQPKMSQISYNISNLL